MGRLDGRVAIVTGAGRGIGRSVALLLASEGASVVVNDLGVAVDGSGPTGPAHDVVAEIGEAGGKAIAAAAKMGIVGLTCSSARSLAKWDADELSDQVERAFGPVLGRKG